MTLIEADRKGIPLVAEVFGQRRAVAAVLAFEQGVVWADIGWAEPTANPFHQAGHPVGEGPWDAGETRFSVMGPVDPLRQELDAWRQIALAMGATREVCAADIRADLGLLVNP